MIATIAKRLVARKTRTEQPGFHELGHCFIFLQRFADSIFSFQQQIILWNEADDPVCHVFCDNCPTLTKIVGVRYVCEVCPDVDLCAVCMRQYIDAKWLNHCKNHPFLLVPALERDSRPIQPTKVLPDNVHTWLRRLVLEFG